MRKKPTVSIVIPVYNVEKFLARCLDSVLGQTFADWEVVCVNDGSLDSSADILGQYAARDKRIKVISKENGGLSDARNVGVSAATGEYVLFLDSDDFIHAQTLEIVVGLAQANNADMVAFGYDARFYRWLRRMISHGVNVDGMLPRARNIKYNPRRIKYFQTDELFKYATERNKNWGRWRVRHCFPPMRLYRRDLIADTPFIHGIIMEDFPWWSAIMLKRPRTVIIKTPLYFYMPNPTSILGSAKALRMIESIATGIEYAHKLYADRATDIQRRYYAREFLWPFIIIAMRQTRALDNPADGDVARRIFTRLMEQGVLDNPPSRRARRYRDKICNFIK